MVAWYCTALAEEIEPVLTARLQQVFGMSEGLLCRMKGSGNYLPITSKKFLLLLFVVAIDDLGGANIFPAIWSASLTARAEGAGCRRRTVHARREAASV